MAYLTVREPSRTTRPDNQIPNLCTQCRHHDSKEHLPLRLTNPSLNRISPPG